MKNRALVVGALLIVVTFVASTGGVPGVSPAGVAYVDPALAAAEHAAESVLVTAGSSAEAARAVAAAGGVVTSELWLIDAVAARVPAAALDRLAARPGIVSVIANRQVAAADAVADDGYVTDLRIELGTFLLEGNEPTPPAVLPDGGFAAFTDNGKLLIVNADGTIRARVSLSGGSGYTSAPQVGPDGTLYIASQSLQIHAINPDGSTRWEFKTSGSNKFIGGLTLSADGAAVYAADDGRSVYALDAASGQKLWQVKASSGAGVVLTGAVAGSDGGLYFSTDKGYVYAFSAAGVLRWAHNTATALKFSPLLDTRGRVFVASTDGKKLFALDAATGQRRFVFTTASKIMAQPKVGPDGSLYLPTEDRALYGLNPDGTQRFLFRPASGHFRTSPVVAPDGALVFAAVEEKILFALDAKTGAERWRYTTLGSIKSSPVLDVDGGLILGSDGADLVRLRLDGTVAFRRTFAPTTDKITQSGASNQKGGALVRLGTAKLFMIGRLRSQWDGRPDVQAGHNKSTWKLVNPVVVDTGASDVHRRGIDGAGVTVAVVDSGIYFDRNVKSELGSAVRKLFLGQADFVSPVCDTYLKDGILYTAGIQHSDRCQTDYTNSRDGYGHGTAVGGVIWSNFVDEETGVFLGVAPGASLYSVRVLDDSGAGTYETVIQGIQHVVAHRSVYNIRVMNLSLSAYATVPYFVDPLNRAVEQAWASGIVVVAAAGNTGPVAESVTVPGNDPYVITVGAVNGNRTPGYWADDVIPQWSAAGPTLDGFAKPDLLAPGSNIVSFMYNDPEGHATQRIVGQHPDFSSTASLFRMNGTSMSTPVVASTVALMLQANPALTPDQVKYRLLETARLAVDAQGAPVYNTFQQGLGRIWVPDAVLASLDPGGRANQGMDINADLAHGFDSEADLSYHYQGLIEKRLSDDGSAYLYFVREPDDSLTGLGAAGPDGVWISPEALASARMTWAGARMTWAGGLSWTGGADAFASARMTWAGARMTWAGGTEAYSTARMTWAGARMTWAGSTEAYSTARMTWAGGLAWAGARMTWAGNTEAYSVARMTWAGASSGVTSTTWVDDQWAVPALAPARPTPAAADLYWPTPTAPAEALPEAGDPTPASPPGENTPAPETPTESAVEATPAATPAP